METPRDVRPSWPLWSLLGLLLLTRGAFVAVLGDVFFYGDEFEKGAAAVAMLDGLGAHIGHHRLAYHYYEGGGFVLSHVDALAFLALGQNLLALKLVAFVFNALVLVAGFRLAERAFGSRAALLFGLLFVFAPESMQKNSMLALGIHYQALLFVLLVLHLGGRILFEQGTSTRTWVALGLAGGFGTYFSYQCALTVAFVGGALILLRRRELFGPRGLAGVAALVVGAAPLIWMYALVGDQITDIHGSSLFGGVDPAERLALLGGFLGSVFDSEHPAAFATSLLLPLSALLGLVACLRTDADPSRDSDTGPSARLRRSWALFLAAYLACFTLAYVCSGFAVGAVSHYFLFHRLSQPWVLVALLAAGGMATWLGDAGARRLVARVVVAAVLLLGALGTLRVVARGNHDDLGANLAVLRETKGYRWDEYIAKIWHHLDGSEVERAEQLLELEVPDPPLLVYTLAVNLFGPAQFDLTEVQSLTAALDPGREDDWYLGLGPMWRVMYGGLEIPDRLERALATEGLDPERRAAVVESLGRFGLGFLVTEDRLREELRIGLAGGLPPEYFRGVGYRLYSVRGDRELAGYQRQTNSPFFIDPARGLRFIAAQDESIRAPLLEGFRRARSEHSLP